MASKDFISKFLKRDKKLLWAFGAAICLAVGALGSTLAANINLNGGDNVEFGQGVAQTTACSGGDSITITPQSTFVNEVGAGTAYFTSVQISGIPSNCLGKVFTIAAYGDSGSAIALTYCSNPGAKLAVRFEGSSSSQTTQSANSMFAEITNADSSSFNVTWQSNICRPSALASAVTRITIQSSAPDPIDGEYVADFTSGNTSFDSTPVVAFDANVSVPSGRIWTNTGSLQSNSDLTFSVQPGIFSSSNTYADMDTTMSAIGSVGSIATTADRMTVEMWVNFHDAGRTYDATLFSFGTSDDRGPVLCGYNLSFNEGYFGINTCNSDTLGISATQLNDGWHHIVWIASTGDRYTQKIYLDGSLLENLVRYDNGDNPSLNEYPRPNIGTGEIGVNSWGFGGLSVKLGALKVYAGEMPGPTVASHAASYQARLP